MPVRIKSRLDDLLDAQVLFIDRKAGGEFIELSDGGNVQDCLLRREDVAAREAADLRMGARF